jgi:adenine-specific DNA-methyltransferase
VVDFRARDHLHAQSSPGRLPLIHPCHFAAGMIRWPRADARKPNAIAWHADTRALFIPRGYYTLAKRFSSKEERRRLVAAVYDPGVVAGRMVGLENHLNYFHASGQGLEPEIAYGLMAYLNATPVDQYLRQFNGHTQVNATDLRSLRFPSQAQLRRLGRAMRALTDRSQEVVDRLLAAACPLPR